MSLKRYVLSGVRLHNTDLQDTDFIGCTFHNCTFLSIAKSDQTWIEREFDGFKMGGECPEQISDEWIARLMNDQTIREPSAAYLQGLAEIQEQTKQAQHPHTSNDPSGGMGGGAPRNFTRSKFEYGVYFCPSSGCEMYERIKNDREVHAEERVQER